MKVLSELSKNEGIEHWKDINYMREICYNNDYVIAPLTAQHIWKDYSATCYSTWLPLPKDEKDILNIILNYSQQVNTMPTRYLKAIGAIK